MLGRVSCIEGISSIVLIRADAQESQTDGSTIEIVFEDDDGEGEEDDEDTETEAPAERTNLTAAEEAQRQSKYFHSR